MHLNLEFFPQEKRVHYSQVITVPCVLKSERKNGKKDKGKKYEKKKQTKLG